MMIFKQNEVHKSAILVEETIKWILEDGEEQQHKIVITTEDIEQFTDMSDGEAIDALVELMDLPGTWNLGRANELALVKHIAELAEKAAKPRSSRQNKKNTMSAATR